MRQRIVRTKVLNISTSANCSASTRVPPALWRSLRRVMAITSLALRVSPAQLPASAPPADAFGTASTRVVVNAREVRVVFPRDTARAWGWSDRKELGYYPMYIWGVSVDGMDGPRILAARVGRDTNEARAFPSLERLVAAAVAQLCSPGMMWHCEPSPIRASVEDGHVVLTLRDSAQVARLFGMRAKSVDAWQRAPGEDGRISRDTAVVEYIAPQIPLPDDATRADAARSQRRYEASISNITRYIAGGEEWHPLWLEVGDSAIVAVTELHCHHDTCMSGSSTARDSGWTISDTRVARVQPVKLDSSDDIIVIYSGGARQYVKALRPGRTMLRVRGLHSAADTAPSARRPERQLEREIIVTPPIRRIEIVPRRHTVRPREIFALRVRALDARGREIVRLPWRLEVLDGEYRSIQIGPKPQRFAFTAPGRVRIAAKLGAHVDTLTVTVLPSDR